MKLNASVYSFVAVTALFLSSCSTPPPAEAPKAIDMAALKTEIQAMEDAYSAAEKAKDAPAVAAYYSDDAISYGRNSEPLSGKAAITEKIAERLSKDTLNYDNVYKVVDLFADGDMAVEIGSWEEVNGSGEVQNRGHYMSYFQKRDGKYVCVRDMNVSSMPDKKEGM
ncbi:MAG TPA: nuclear transport factor 2 family protein [Bacteroidia bacterium]|nr:nuclear transport factor 2 family protein [Bacteroidia bacterium]